MGKRLAVFWTPEGKPITWVMKEGDAASEAAKITHDSRTGGKIRDLPGVRILGSWSGFRLHRRALPLAVATVAILAAVFLGSWIVSEPSFENDIRDLTPVDDGSLSGSVLDETINLGTYHALFIGIEDYKHNSLEIRDLTTPIDDIEHLHKLLVRVYGFAEENVLELRDADASLTGITDALIDYRRLDRSANLLIYYAGHGHLEPNTQDGFWIPRIDERGIDLALERGIPTPRSAYKSRACACHFR